MNPNAPAGAPQQAPRKALSDRLMPVLLDRLIDAEPGNQKEAVASRVMSSALYRHSVLRDLRWLLNAISLGSDVDCSAYPYVRDSVINFGLPPFSGQQLSELDWPQLVEGVRSAIERFEPRIDPSTLEVRGLTHADSTAHHNLIGLEIKGRLWSKPYPLDLLLRSQIDLETGVVHLVDQQAGVV